MSNYTTVKMKKKTREILRKIEGQITIETNGKKITLDQAIECLDLGYKNPDFIESDYLRVIKAT